MSVFERFWGVVILPSAVSHVNHLHPPRLPPVFFSRQHGAYLAAACDALVGVALGSFTSPEPSGEIISESDCDELDKVSSVVCLFVCGLLGCLTTDVV